VSTEEFLRAEARAGSPRASRRVSAPPVTASAWSRELEVICPDGLRGYFLIVADFIRWAREHGVPVGPAAVGAGSLVPTAEDYDLDPLKYTCCSSAS